MTDYIHTAACRAQGCRVLSTAVGWLPLLPAVQGGVCVGLVVRDHLMKLLVEAVKRGTCQHLEVPFRWVLRS